jgi:acetyl esterase/lipase
MKRLSLLLLAAVIGLIASMPAQHAAVKPHLPPRDEYILQENVIYGRKFGTALTLDVVRPKQHANGAAVVHVVSGGWRSDCMAVRIPYFAECYFGEFLKRGYAVFAVVHGSQPRFTIPEAVEDVQRAVRYIRYHAHDFHIDSERIGITGSSAGGHLALMLGTTGKDGNAEAWDPVERVSSRVQAVACFYPPTDFLNYGGKGKVALGSGTLERLKASFDFVEFDDIDQRFKQVVDERRRRAIGKRISPIYHVSKETAPTLIVQGDADETVPLQQAESMLARLKAAGIPSQLHIKAGAGHGWGDVDKDLAAFADWFDRYLAPKDAKK